MREFWCQLLAKVGKYDVRCVKDADGNEGRLYSCVEYAEEHPHPPIGEQLWLSINGTFVEVTDPAQLEGLDDCCSCQKPDCVESQEWTYGIDNTGTNTLWDAIYRIKLSDGSILDFAQTSQGAAGQWTAQQTEWSANIQAAADAAGLQWFVEPRFIDNTNPSNLDGSSPGPGGTPSGLPGAPSVPVATALDEGGMRWRYVNIQICPGQPVPVSAEILEVTNSNGATSRDPGYQLTTAGAVLGPIQKFFVCLTCGKAPKWYLEDGITEAEPGQIPFCWEPCGTLTLADAPPDRECQFFIDLACDDNGQSDPTLFTNQITRRATVCNGEQINLEYFEEDPTDPTALIDYTLVGDFVDCATGEPVPLPTPPCDDFISIGTLFQMEGVTGTLRNREWHDTAPTVPVADSDTAIGRDFRTQHDFSLPTTVDAPVSSLNLNDTDNTPNELDIQVVEGYLIADTPVLARYFNNSEGYWAVELGECCGPLRVIAESGGSGTGREMLFQIPAGVHQVRLWNIDSGGTSSAATFGYSTDGGATYVNGTPPEISYSTTKPVERCIPAIKCIPAGLIRNALDMSLIDLDTVTVCSRLCEPTLEAQMLDKLCGILDALTCEGDSLGDPIGDQTVCSTRKMGANFTSGAAGEATHEAGSLFDTNGNVDAWMGTFTVTDSAGATHVFSDGQTITGLASGAVQSVSFTGEVEWSENGETYRCPVTDKLISAGFTVN